MPQVSAAPAEPKEAAAVADVHLLRNATACQAMQGDKDCHWSTRLLCAAIVS